MFVREYRYYQHLHRPSKHTQLASPGLADRPAQWHSERNATHTQRDTLQGSLIIEWVVAYVGSAGLLHVEYMCIRMYM